MLATRFANNAHSLRSAVPLTDDQIRRVAPSIFAEAKHESRSDRYTYLPTIDVLRGLMREGFMPFAVAQSRCRDQGRREFTKHMVRMRRTSDDMVAVGDERPEIVLINSHDGTSAYQMLAGMFRLACLNGMVVPSGMVSDVRVPHKGDIASQVIEGAFTIVKDFGKVEESAGAMKAITLTQPEQLALGRAAIVAKYGESETGGYPITEAQVITPRRYADTGADLWTTFNRVQENLVRGGLDSRSANGRRTRTREVAGISQNVQLNRALWTLADEMARIKQAA